ncbi:CCN_G0048720.mRNA.1.CDS.1 [Saccharomyces cerevisiae]|nr:HLJ1_G0037780.mRNA.1.CDS.1 [Saccharomyces cerevisiae]CAI4760045.1 BAI_1a_G0048570.mRNA.1.CDS.1 [Saccharomyces cerevisiae]CAI4769118.1 CCN_G0048720.mRNA.1.CDS.1 [Saccharomyces cerevisiae]CAI7330075.1 BAI_1a_G0048570.mRNA.1.CDS.1 [Saccharomyces cerevisiae]CAI7455469.1 CCN_G0048720.mRNA.1.CDS.1 [Saccharomyces cerevisiae]
MIRPLCSKIIISYIFAISQFLLAANAWSPTDSYVPGTVSCPDDINLVREATSISQNESAWLEKRNKVTSVALKDFLTRATANFSDSSEVLSKLFNDGNSENLPKIAVAVSGGGYRSMLTGAGVLAAMDNRTGGAYEHGLGGLLQSTTYLSGASGGNWLVGTLALNNWTSVQDILNNMQNDDSIWDLSDSIVTPGGINIFKTAKRWDHISNAVESKQNADYNTSLADIWGRALAYNFFPSLNRGGIGLTWSSIRDFPVFQNAEMPFPISVADGRYPGTKVINLNATVFEFNPFEMGSWDPSLNSFANVKYLGTNVSNGVPLERGKCTAGFDNAGFIMGTSSTLFNQFLLRINSTHLPSFITRLARHFLKDLSQDFNDIAVYSPNPFKDTKFLDSDYTTSIVDSDSLFLVDGGEDDENVPVLPLIQKERDVDIIFAVDNSADMRLAWPDGSSLVHTYERQFVKQGQGMSFPYVPDTNTFVNLGLNKKPTFFGCDANNLTDLQYIPPLVVYLPNAEYSFNSNQSAFKLSYSESQRRSMIQNGFEIATRNNFTDDPEFMGCVGCAIIRRKQQALNITLPPECETCFKNYCWNGTLDTTPLPDVEKDVHHSFINVNSFNSSIGQEESLYAGSSASQSSSSSSSSEIPSATATLEKKAATNSGSHLSGISVKFSAMIMLTLLMFTGAV